MATFLRCPHCGKVQRDLQGEHLSRNDAGDLLDLNGRIINEYPDEKWLPIWCEHCHKISRGYYWEECTRDDWGWWDRARAWWLWHWDALVDRFRF